MEEQKMIELPISWLEELLRLSQEVDNRLNDPEKDHKMWLHGLLGYISSAHTLIKLKAKKK